MLGIEPGAARPGSRYAASPWFVTSIGIVISSKSFKTVTYFVTLLVVNMDFSAPNTVLDNSPLVGYDSRLSGFGLRTMDFIFSHDNDRFMIKGATTVEKLGHTFHMQAGKIGFSSFIIDN